MDGRTLLGPVVTGPTPVSLDEIELHGFADASSRAYAAAVYLRCTDATGNVTVRLLVAKTKVAPVKRVSFPRLELCGALLLARLMRNTATGLGLKSASIFAWTDAAVVLAWIRSHPARWKTFVAHRVAEVQTLVPPERWRYVPTTDNPADAATRGLSPTKLANLDLW
ncbi:gag-pol protein [Lasius niger]|uniref:Gag-pol protein n=1 Tax=Lasius niger TaxID=67767 RepID=A0A0J7KCZ4_LASNI|nr:gag-pol protein [Lasius niger]